MPNPSHQYDDISHSTPNVSSILRSRIEVAPKIGNSVAKAQSWQLYIAEVCPCWITHGPLGPCDFAKNS